MLAEYYYNLREFERTELRKLEIVIYEDAAELLLFVRGSMVAFIVKWIFFSQIYSTWKTSQTYDLRN